MHAAKACHLRLLSARQNRPDMYKAAEPRSRLRLRICRQAYSMAANGIKMGASGGVFVGVSQLEYARICLAADSGLNAYYATGAHLSVTSGRLAYTFGLRGPTMTGAPSSATFCMVSTSKSFHPHAWAKDCSAWKPACSSTRRFLAHCRLD